MAEQESEIKKIIEYLSPNEVKIIPYLKEENLLNIHKKTEMDKTAIMRSLEFLSNKNIITLTIKKQETIQLGINGLLYQKQGLPERRLSNLIIKKNSIPLNEAKELSKLNDNEFKAALGALKKKALINLVNGNIILLAKKEELIQKTLEEKFLESLPKKLEDLK